MDELNLAVARNQNSSQSRSTQFRETRCSYFLNLNLNQHQLNQAALAVADDIELEMDNERRVVIRGRRYSISGKEMGIAVKWRWRVVVAENAAGSWWSTRKSRIRAFKMPEEVNVGAIRGSFEQGIVHVVMPKFRRNRSISSPYYHLNIFHSSASASHSPTLQQTLRRTKRRRTRKLIAKTRTALIPFPPILTL